MRTLLIALAATCVMGFLATRATRADDNSKQTTITGILIDQACGAKMMNEDDPEKAAAAHPKSCATKDACAASGYAVISGKQMIKFDDNGNSLAKDWLAKTDKTDDLRVTVQGAQTGDTIAVTSLTAAPDENK
jgi:hypothetical protein